MKSYDTLTEALNDLQKRGYTCDFNLREKDIESKKLKESYQPDYFEIIEVHRFEGMSSTDDSSVLYVIETDTGLKGTLVDAYGTYANSVSKEMLDKLRFKK